MESTRDNSYDQQPYPNLSYAYTHPDHLAVLARLLGLDPVPVKKCRVLELGCASGANLIPMAYGLPESEFVGIDLSQKQVDFGLEALERLGVKNMTLRAMDIMGDTDDLGQFDYIIAHGVYSWVPPDVRDKVLHICEHNLSPRGIAFVSYNVYPGWGILKVLREAMLYQTRGIDDPAEKAKKARETLDFLESSVSVKSSYGSLVRWYVSFIKKELVKLGPLADAYLLHDQLEDVNNPVYFHQFVEHIAAHNLCHVVDAEFRDSFPYDLSPEVVKRLDAEVDDFAEREQYMDLLRNKLFRQSLLCHADREVVRDLNPQTVQDFYVASQAHWVAESGEIDLKSQKTERFQSPGGVKVSTDHPVSKAAMFHLIEASPYAVLFTDLFAAARERLELPAAADTDPELLASDARVLATNLLHSFRASKQLLSFHTYYPEVFAQVSDQPLASPIARFQAEEMSMVTNLWHDRVHLDSFKQYVLSCLDGTRDREAVIRQLMAHAEAGQISVAREGKLVEDMQVLREILDDTLDGHLAWLADRALLIA